MNRPTEISEAIRLYRDRTASHGKLFRSALIDMDGTLYDSMGNHTASWHRLATELGFNVERDSFYLFEGMTGRQTITRLFNQFRGKTPTQQEIEELYHRKTVYFNELPKAKPMPGADIFLNRLKACGIVPVLVTGSGQKSLIERLERDFPDTFRHETMITAADVDHGKPDPEPYLRGMAKASTLPEESVVVENAPIGVKAGATSGAFTIGLTTGPIPADVLYEAGADFVLPSMEALAELTDKIFLPQGNI